MIRVELNDAAVKSYINKLENLYDLEYINNLYPIYYI
jgi:hypothetical protein